MASKQLSVAGNDTGLQQADKTNPFDKLIASDQLTYLPNLYLRQYKAVDELVRLRQDFPQQRILLKRPYTQWDAVLDEMRFRSRVVLQEKKYKVVQRAQTVKQLKLEVQRGQLREEENYHFHRLTSSYLSEAVLGLFQQQGKSMEVELKVEPKEEEQKAVVKKNQDDIFVEGGDDYYDIPEENNLLDDLLNDPIVQKKEEYVEREQTYIEPISVVLAAKYAQSKNGAEFEPSASISHKASLKRINQSVRRRLKIKEEEEELPGRSLSSATVFLSNLLNTQPESKAKNIIELPSRTQWLFTSDRPRKRKEDDTFQLRWSPQQMQKFQQRNEKFNLRKGKIDNNILVMSLSNDEEQYKRYFEKNISADRAFPPTLQNIPKLQIQHTQKYYNEFHDIEYESFIRKYNKRTIFEKFSAKAPFLFPQNYSLDELQDNQTINAGKIFVHPPEKVLDRLIYRISDYKLAASVRSDFSHIRMDLNQMLILAFLAKKYVRKFGNDWRSITQFIAMHPVFSNHHITQEVVQEVYQLVAKFDHSDPLAEINLWDKKILPFDYYGCYSYAQFGENLYQKQEYKRPQKMIAEEETDEDSKFDFDRYEQMIKEAPQVPILDELEALEEEYRLFARDVFDSMSKSDHNFILNREDKFDKIRSVLEKFQQAPQKIEYTAEDRDKRENVGKVLDEMLASSKGGDFKQATPFRKKKNINERNNQLVKILQALRNKNVGVSSQGQPKKPEEANKGFPQANVPKSVPTASNPAPAPAPKQNEAVQQKKTIQKSPQKADKKQLGAPPKKDRKNKDGEEKK